MKRPSELSKMQINIDADADLAINSIEKLRFAISELNAELRTTVKLKKQIEQTGWFKRILNLVRN